jgi:hypothetical protein
MCKSFLNKVRLSEAQKNVILIILLLLHIFSFVISVFFLYRFLDINKKANTPLINEEKSLLPGEVPEEFKAGNTGEIPEAEIKEKGLLLVPQMIVNTRGTVLSVQSDRLTIEGEGSSFTDQQPRTITVIFTDSTTTNDPAQKTFYMGLKGLKFIQTGMKISIGGAENIKGKTEFKADIVNIDY